MIEGDNIVIEEMSFDVYGLGFRIVSNPTINSVNLETSEDGLFFSDVTDGNVQDTILDISDGNGLCYRPRYKWYEYSIR